MKWRRNSYDIIAKICELALRGTLKTHVMYQCKLSYEQVEEYLPFLLEKGLLVVEDSHKKLSGRGITFGSKVIYKTTEKGKRFIRCFETVKNILASNEVDLWLPKRVETST